MKPRSGIAEIILGGKPNKDDEPPMSEESPSSSREDEEDDYEGSEGERAACDEAFDALKEDDREGFCRALLALKKM